MESNLFTENEEKIMQQEWLILEITEQICALMEEKGINKAELAKKLGKSKGYVTQLLDGRANMTLRTVSDVFFVLNSSLMVDTKPLGYHVSPKFSNNFVVSNFQFSKSTVQKTKTDNKFRMAS